MTVVQSSGRKKAQKLLREAGKLFTDGFMASNVNAIILRSKEPGVCWKAGGIVGFAAISEFSGPNSMEDGSPTLFRLRVNYRPPPAIGYHLKSPAVRHKLGLHANPQIADNPILELTALPEEIGKFGSWLLAWLDNQFFQKPTPPVPPIPLVAWGVDGMTRESKPDFMTMNGNWRYCEYLWTPEALAVFEPWLQKD